MAETFSAAFYFQIIVSGMAPQALILSFLLCPRRGPSDKTKEMTAVSQFNLVDQ